MIRIVFFLCFGLLTTVPLTAQEQPENLNAINNYKYFVVPVKYEMLNDADKYQLNSLTKFLFDKYGYETYMENDPFPTDLRLDKCLALYVEVVKAKGGLLGTKLKIDLSDCNGNLVTSSRVGKSREKEFRVAYNLALRNAFQTFQQYPYAYKPKEENTPKIETEQAESKKTEVDADAVIAEVAAVSVAAEAAVSSDQIVSDEVVTPKTESSDLEEQNKILYAQSIPNGFQVVDSTPKVIMILLETGKSNVFVVKGQDAIVYEEDGFWYLSENTGNAVDVQQLHIKF